MSSVPLKQSHSLSISIQNRFAPLAQTYNTAGATAVHLLATREGKSGDHSELRGLQEVAEVNFVMFLDSGVCQAADHNHHSLVEFKWEIHVSDYNQVKLKIIL